MILASKHADKYGSCVALAVPGSVSFGDMTVVTSVYLHKFLAVTQEEGT